MGSTFSYICNQPYTIEAECVDDLQIFTNRGSIAFDAARNPNLNTKRLMYYAKKTKNQEIIEECEKICEQNKKWKEIGEIKGNTTILDTLVLGTVTLRYLII